MNKKCYPNLHEIEMRFLLCFSTTYLCETAFFAMTVLKMIQRNQLHPGLEELLGTSAGGG
jgi:hypothetical protein